MFGRRQTQSSQWVKQGLNLVARHSDLPCSWNGIAIAHKEGHEAESALIQCFYGWEEVPMPRRMLYRELAIVMGLASALPLWSKTIKPMNSLIQSLERTKEKEREL